MKYLRTKYENNYASNCFTLITSFLIHFFIVTTNNWIFQTMIRFDKNIWTAAQGVGFLMYPILGWIADVRVTQYRMIKISFTLVLSCLIMMTFFNISLILKLQLTEYVGTIFSILVVVVGITGFGMYESNAIQFGMDQMLEASSEQLSSFIHWYFWSIHIGPLVIYYVLLMVLFYIQKHCIIDLDGDYENLRVFGYILLLPYVIQVILIIFGLYFMKKSAKHVYINPGKTNPFKLILGVTKFAWKHKYPVNRSALTFWENDIPSRIDLGKHKYGGPFTNEQVENVKTLFQLLLLIISLLGFQLSGDGYSLSQYMMYNLGCPTVWTMALLVMNPEHVTLLVIVIGIPLYQLFVKRYFGKYTPNLLKRVRIGLYLCLIREAIYPIISLLTASTKHISQCYINELYEYEKDNTSITTLCLLANTKAVVNGTCQTVCPSFAKHDNLFLLLILPQILNGLSYLLVFMTVIEFICAQSPHMMKGLLIGIWYASFSIKYLVVNIFDGYIVEENAWNIYHSAKGFGIFLSIVSFSLVFKFYHYRERDEIVNEQVIIEEQYERELLHNADEEIDIGEDDDELAQLLQYSHTHYQT